MERNIIKQLAAWKDNPEKKPLILQGVRQCGKTWALKEFGRRFYDDTAYFNFEGNDSLLVRFEGDLDPERIIGELGIFRKKPIEKGKTLVIFDEIQFSNRALNSLKYFCENSPGSHIVCAGSLLGLALSRPLSFPVGKVNFLTLRPMDFHEFLLANGEEPLCGYLEDLPAGEPLSPLFAQKLEQYLRNYYICGGMPAAVSSWIEHRDIEKLENVQREILNSYELDFAKYAASGEFPKLRAIWHSIPDQLAKENSKFIFGQVKKGQRSKDLEDALQWLLGAGLVHKLVKVEKPFMPLSAYGDQSFFKLYAADPGLLRFMSGLPAIAVLEKNETFKEFKGALTENYVLCELVNLYNTPQFYWRSNNTAEVDFVIQNGMDIVPLEVKSERNNRAKSLAEYIKKYSPRMAVKTSMYQAIPRNTGGSGVLYVPLYMLWLLKKYLGGI
jgi:predicted AAA+ superfamily ATPase